MVFGADRWRSRDHGGRGHNRVWQDGPWKPRDQGDRKHNAPLQHEDELKTMVAERLIGAIVQAEGSRQVVAASVVALFRVIINNEGETAKVMKEHEEITAVAEKHFGENAGVAKVCSEVKARGQHVLAKQLSEHHRARKRLAHPRVNDANIASKLDKLLGESRKSVEAPPVLNDQPVSALCELVAPKGDMEAIVVMDDVGAKGKKETVARDASTFTDHFLHFDDCPLHTWKCDCGTKLESILKNAFQHSSSSSTSLSEGLGDRDG